jgi:WD40 repeat protein
MALKSFSIDPESSRLAFIVQSGPQQAAFVDGKEVARAKTISPVRWAPAGGRWACVQVDGDKQHLILDAKAGLSRDRIGAMEFSPDGKRFACVVVEGGKAWVELDGTPQKEFDGINGLAFSADGKRFAYVARMGEGAAAVVDGVEGDPVSLLHGLAFSADSKHVAYSVWDSRGGAMIVDGRRSKVYRHVGRPLFSPNGGRLAYEVQEGGKISLIVDGKEWDGFESGTSMAVSASFSPDGQRVAWRVEPTLKEPLIVVDGVRQECLPTVAHIPLTFSPDGRRLAYVAHEGSDMLAVVDGKPGRPERVILSAVVFSPDGRRTAYVARDERFRHFVVVDGKPGAPHAEVRDPVFSPEGTSLAYVARDGARILRKLYAEAAPPRPEPEPMKPAAAPIPSGALDAAGDPMPTGFTRRLGSARLSQVDRGLGDVAFSPDGKRIASVGGAAAIKLWDSATGKELRTLTGHSGGLGLIAFSSDGTLLASGGRDRTVRIWEVESGRTLQVLKGHSGEITSLSFSPDSRKLLSACRGPDPRLWDVATGQEIFRLKRHGESITKAIFAADGRTIYTHSFIGNATFAWNPEDGASIPERTGRIPALRNLSFSPRAEFVVDVDRSSGRGSQEVQVFELATGKKQSAFDVDADFRGVVGWTKDETLIAVLAEGGRITIRDRDTGKERQSLACGEGSRIDRLAFSPDGRRLAAMAQGFVRVWDLGTGRELFDGRHSGMVRRIVYAPNGRTIATSGTDQTVRLWETATGRMIANLGSHGYTDPAPAFLPGGIRLLTVDAKRGIRSWDSESGKEERTIPIHLMSGAGPLPVTQFALSPDGKRAAVFWPDRGSWLLIVDLESGKTVLEGSSKGLWNKDSAASLAYSADGKSIIASGGAGTIVTWNADTAKPWVRFEAGAQFNSLAIPSPDGAQVVASLQDSSVRFWNLVTGKETGMIRAQKWVSAVAFSLDGRALVTAGDQTVRWWDAKEGKEIAPPAAVAGHMFSLAFSPDGKELAVGGEDGTVLLQDVPPTARR